MTSETLIDFTARLEPWLWGASGALLVVLGVDALLRERRPGARALDDPIRPATERLLLAVILAVALVVRLVGWDSVLTPIFWFSEMSTLFVDPMIQRGTVSATWVASLSRTQVQHPHEAAALLPLLVAVQHLVGPRFGLPVLSGALVGMLAIVAAWALGRRICSQAFGLLFAAFVAFSPMAITWSRLSPLCSTGAMHVLLTLLIGWEAGRRGSAVWAVATGLVAWASIYQYHGARIAIPLAAAAIVAGSQRAWMVGRGVMLVLVAAGVFGATAYAIRGHVTPTELWPSYGGYAGNKGEQSIAEFVDENLPTLKHEVPNAIARYFTTGRAGVASDVFEPGLAEGGLVLVPTAILGALGVLVVIRHFARQWLWLAVAALAFAVPAISSMTARRALVFDVAWCAFAAHGLLALVDWLGSAWPRAVRGRAAALVVTLVGTWSVTAVFALSAAMTPGIAQHVPFGDAGFGDGIACGRCVDAAKRWQGEMADGAFVVLFDNDVWRENRTSPGGLPMYGKIAALAGGGRERFVEAYSLMGAWDLEPPTPGVMYDRQRTDFATELAARIARSGASRIVWHFERPTAWERWVARALAAAGGTREDFPSPLSPWPGIRVTTPPERRREAFDVIRGLARGLGPDEESRCVTLREVAAPNAVAPVYLLVTGDEGLDRPPEWLMASWRNHRYGRSDLATFSSPVGGAVTAVPGGARVELMGEKGERYVYAPPAMERTVQQAALPAAYTLNCVARVGAHWWMVAPASGRVASTDPVAAAAVPPADWIGIAPGPDGTVVLADASQSLLVMDVANRRVRSRFPARVFASVRDVADECSPIAVGAGWVATMDLRSSVLAFYDLTGRDLGSKRVDRLIRVPYPFTAIGGAGRHLGVAAGAQVRTFEVAIDPACLTAEPRP